jgi:ABC-type maltose transport system permease subunit
MAWRCGGPIPVLTIFLFAQRWIVESLATSGIR